MGDTWNSEPFVRASNVLVDAENRNDFQNQVESNLFNSLILCCVNFSCLPYQHPILSILRSSFWGNFSIFAIQDSFKTLHDYYLLAKDSFGLFQTWSEHFKIWLLLLKVFHISIKRFMTDLKLLRSSLRFVKTLLDLLQNRHDSWRHVYNFWDSTFFLFLLGFFWSFLKL